MTEHLKQNLGNKGIMVKRCIITSVTLLPSVADALQERTIFQFKNTLERKQFAYNQRTLNDKEEEEKEKLVMDEKGKDENEQAYLTQMSKQKEIEAVKAKNSRITSEW